MTDPDDSEPDELESDDFAEMLRALARAPSAVVRNELLGAGIDAASVVGKRYRIERQLGQGGMGDVFLGADTRLQRRVAVKVGRAADTEQLGQRSLAEAQAIARMSHPNVVEVFEVGTHSGRPYIVMEYVEGHSAAHWAKSARRSAAEVLAVYRQAAAGLAAAHSASLVHRDFKPANVLVGDDGRVRVVDFGLAEPSDGVTLQRIDDDLFSRTTSSRTVAGTLGFIPPEVYAGDEASAKGDQFAFCVSVWEALYDSLPFVGSTPQAVRRATMAGMITPPHERDVPAWVERALRKGLAVDPAARHRDMRALVRALDPRARRRWRRGLLTALGLVGAAIGVASLGVGPAVPEACAQEATAPWNEATAAKVAAALRATGAPDSERAVERVNSELDAWAVAWAAARSKACEAGLEATPADRSFRCLDRSEAQLAAALDVLEGATAQTVARHYELLATLDSPARCTDAAMVGDAEPPPPRSANVESVAEARAKLDRVDALLAGGRVEEATRIADATLVRARTLGYAPLTAEALFATAHAARIRDARSTAAELFAQAYEAAVGVGSDALAAESARSVAWLVAATNRDVAAVEVWLRAAEAAQRRLGVEPEDSWEFLEAKGRALQYTDRERQARIVLTRAAQLQGEKEVGLLPRLRLHSIWAYTVASADVDEAQRIFTSAVEEAEAEGVEDHPIIADLRLHYSSCLVQLQLDRDGLQQAQRAVAIRRRIFGESAPSVGVALRFVAVAQREGGDLEGSAATATQSLAIARARDPPDAHAEALALTTLGIALLGSGDLNEAEGRLGEAASIFTGVGAHANATAARARLSQAMRVAGRYQEALEQLTLAIEESHGTWHADVRNMGALWASRSSVNASLGHYEDAHVDLDRATEFFSLAYDGERKIHGLLASSRAKIYADARETEKAGEWYRRALEIYARNGGVADEDAVIVHASLARVLLDAGEYSQALAEADRTLELLKNLGDAFKATHARVTYSRAEALYALGRRSKAKTLVASAYDELVSTGRDPDMQALMRTWLDDPSQRSRNQGGAADIAFAEALLADKAAPNVRLRGEDEDGQVHRSGGEEHR